MVTQWLVAIMKPMTVWLSAGRRLRLSCPFPRGYDTRILHQVEYTSE